MTVEVRLLGLRARISGPSALVREIREVLPTLPRWLDDDAATVASFAIETDLPARLIPHAVGSTGHGVVGARNGSFSPYLDLAARRACRIERDGVTVWESDRLDQVVPYLEWALNAAALEQLSSAYLLHAGTVAVGDQGVLLAGGSGRGKTTLVAALVHGAGFTYFSDEVAVIEPATRRLLPFAKSLYVRVGSRDALAPFGLPPDAAPRYQQLDGETAWYIVPNEEWLPQAPATPRYIVFPHFVPDAPLELSPVTRSAALERLLEQSFNLQMHGAAGIQGLVSLLREVDCYALTFGQLDEAVDALRRLVATRELRISTDP